MDISTEPPHSPPTPSPCAIRSRVSSAGAVYPSVAYPGSRPIRNVLIPISISVVTSIALRPTRSPKWPKIAAPTGRAAKPTNWVPKDSRTPVYAACLGKNSAGKTSADAVP